jgi:hypothetical protein
MARKRKKNPEPLTILAIAAAAGAAIYAWVKRSEKKKTTKKAGTAAPPQKKSGGGTKKKPSAPQGSDLYPPGVTPEDMEAFDFLEYKPGPQTVLQFQQQFNAVNTGLLEADFPELLPMTISEDNDMGPDTRAALGKAVAAVPTYKMSWPAIVLTFGGIA